MFNPRIDELRRRVQEDPASIAFAQLAEEHRRAGDFEEAVRVSREGLTRHPSYVSARVTLGRALMELGHHGEAKRELDIALLAAPDNLAAIRALAEIHQRRGEFDQAARQFTTSLDVASAEMIVPPPPVPEASQPAPDIPDPVTDLLPALDLAVFDTVVPDVPVEPPPVETAPSDSAHEDQVEDPALKELEGWLGAILADRAQRA